MEKHDQPFCVIGSKGSFKGVRFNHLPPLEYEHREYGPEGNPEIEKLNYQFNLLRGQMVYLQNKIQIPKKMTQPSKAASTQRGVEL